MGLGDLLIQAKLLTAEQVKKALKLQAGQGGRLGDSLVASGFIAQDVLDAFRHRIPTEPADIAATKINETDLLNLLMKLIYAGHLKTIREFVDAIKLPYQIVHDLVQMAVDRQLLRTMPSREPITWTRIAA